jgi:hypothetical protein
MSGSKGVISGYTELVLDDAAKDGGGDFVETLKQLSMGIREDNCPYVQSCVQIVLVKPSYSFLLGIHSHFSGLLSPWLKPWTSKLIFWRGYVHTGRFWFSSPDVHSLCDYRRNGRSVDVGKYTVAVRHLLAYGSRLRP